MARLLEKEEQLYMDEAEQIAINDGSDKAEEMEKEKEKHLNDVEKELKDNKKIVDEINDAKAPSIKVSKCNEQLSLNEEDIEEAIPRDLAKAYDASRFKRDASNKDKNTDYQKDEYKLVSKEEAKKILKNDKDAWVNFRLLIGKRLIILNSYGYATSDDRYRYKYVDYDKQYVNRNGNRISDTAKMSKEHLFDIADKIYVTTENDPAYNKDPQMMATRAANKADNERAEYTSMGRCKRSVGGQSRGQRKPWSSQKELEDEIKDYKQRLAELQDRLENKAISQEYFDKRKEELLADIKDCEANIGKIKDFNARMRYASSEADLQKKYDKYVELKNRLVGFDDRISRAKSKLDLSKSQGSTETRKTKEELQELRNRLRDINRRISICELRLEGTDEEDNEEVKQRQAEYDNIMSEFGNVKQELNNILGKSESFNEDASLKLLDLVSRNLDEELEEVLDEMYPDGYTDKELEDLLKDEDLDDLFGGEDEE